MSEMVKEYAQRKLINENTQASSPGPQPTCHSLPEIPGFRPSLLQTPHIHL